MKSKKILLVASALLTSGSALAAEVSSTVELTNDYRYRGISQSAGNEALQASLDVAFDSGFYAGAWVSNVDFDDDAKTELDFYAGYYGEINDNVAYDITLSRFTYPGYDFDSDYTEIGAKLFFGDFTLEYGHTNNFANSDEVSQYVALDYSKLISEKVSVFDEVTFNAHAGHSFGSYWSDIDIGEYSDYSVGVSANVKGFDVSLNYLFNDIDEPMQFDNGAFQNDNTLLLTVGYTF